MTSKEILQKISLSPDSLFDAFGPRLSLKDEFMLREIDRILCHRVNIIIDRALVGGPEIRIRQEDREYILEMTRVRKEIRKVLDRYCGLPFGQVAYN